MIRRVHVTALNIGSIALDQAEAHHVRDVLRLEVGSELELFDDAGEKARGPIIHINSANVVVQIKNIIASDTSAIRLIVASAIPKGDRADWMVEKLTELGVTTFIPLITERSVVLPAGKNKIKRWERIAIEAAKQSRRSGVMTIAPLTALADAIASVKTGWYLSTAADAAPTEQAEISQQHTLMIGPEGGWTSAELAQMHVAGLKAIGLTATVLRVETAAVVAAAVVMCRKPKEAR